MSDGEKEGFGRKVASSTAVAVATQAVVFVGTALIGWLSGSFALVWEFALANPGECAVSCLMALLVGGFIGQYARLRWMRRKGVTAESVRALKEKVADLRADVDRLTALADAEETKRLQIAEQRRRDEEAAEAKERARLAMNRDEFVREPSGEKKAMAAALYLMDGHRFCGRENLERDVEALSRETCYFGGELCFFVFDRRGADSVIMRLESWLEEMFDAFPDMATEFPDDALEEARETMLRWSL